MSKTITDAVAWVRDTVGDISGIRAAPDGLPDNSAIYPLFVAWPGASRCYREDAGTVRGLWSIVGQLHFSRPDLRDAAAQATPYYRLIEFALLASPTLGGTCDAFGELTFSRLQPMKWGDTPTIGFEFVVTDVKIREASAAT